MRRVIVSLLTVACGAAVCGLSAQVGFSQSTSIDFVGAAPPSEFTWSDQMHLTPRGLETLPVEDSRSARVLWWQSPPIAMGPSWRPPRSLSLTLTIRGLEVSDGPSRAFLRAFFRYSADRVHWSSWYMLRSVAPTATLAPGEFDAWLQLPNAARERYAELMREWWKTKPAWPSDEHEFCVWLANQHRGYFATEVPFAGYVQVRAEGEAHAMRIAGLIISQSSMGSGFGAVPQGTRRATADGRWFFDLNETGGR